MPIRFKQEGNFNNIEKFLKTSSKRDLKKILSYYGQQGVEALSAATPKDTGKTASSWYYKIEVKRRGVSITWCNDNFANNIPVALLIQYGHGFQNGTYVEGIDYINPAIKPIFRTLARAAWKEVTGK